MGDRAISCSTSLHLPSSVYKTLTRWSESVYPNEGCGLLIGRFGEGGAKEVVQFVPLKNELLEVQHEKAVTLPANRQGYGAGPTEFAMSPGEFHSVSLQAEKEGLDVIGVVHTHPDHPAQPSTIDSAQPFLAFWSNVIIAVDHGKMVDAKSWFRKDDEVPFANEEIQVI